jgi:hypothetical protein
VSLFELGQVVITRAALAFCEVNEIQPVDLVRRRAGGDWGDLDVEDMEANLTAIRNDFRIFSSYKFTAGQVWVITEADRSSTCILLPDDY